MASMEEIKSQLLQIANENQSRVDNFPAVRKLLDPLFDYLANHNQHTADEIFERKVGLWKQIWTDDSDDVKVNGPLTSTDRTRTYQYVYGDGTFWNFNEVMLPFKLKFSAFLSSYYKKEKDGNGVHIGFDALKVRPGGLGTEASLKDLIDTIKAGDLSRTFDLSRTAKAPKGPVNATGYNETIYIDDNLRLDRAYNDADKVVDLYVLKRLP